MVSNTLGVSLQDLLETLERLRQEYGGTLEYQALRRQLPEEWPL